MDTQPIRVLLVDDDEDDYVMTRDLLAELGRGAFLLDWVSSYEEARATVIRGEHDVYLLDYRLGERSGLDLLREAGEEGRGAPMILLTGQGGDEVDAEAMKAGAADYLIKGRLEATLLGRSIRYAVERARASRALRESEERYHRLVELSPDAILVHADGEVVFVNGAGVKLLGADTGEQIVGRPIKEFVRHDRQDGVGRRIYGAAGDVSDATFLEEKLVRSDGTEVCVEAAAVPFVYKDRPAVQVVARDISRRKQMEERLLHDAFHDALTGLPNRALFMDHLRLAVERARRPKKKYLFAVLFLDLDRFKIINDSLGHTMGDQLLVATAGRIQKCLRHLDTVARFGGDEFAVLLDGVEDVNDTIRVAQRLQRELTTPINVGGHEVFTSVSIGIALSNTGYERPEDVVRDADTAMYRAKAAGKSRYEIFDTGMHSRAVALLRLETDLRRAVEREEFVVHYQPIVSLSDDSIQGFEALVRWRHPERGLVTPSEFIPVAEETGLIIPLGRWVLREACRQMHRLQAASPARPLSLSVNLSGKQFMQPDLVGQVKQVLSETGFDPRRLHLEITESSVIENTETVTEMLMQLRALGIRLSMDDFGTGYSSLSYLHRFPIHTLKIDRSFVSGGDGENEIVRTIIMLARNMGMDIVAEGVETKEQLAYLKELKCEYGQGFLFSRPLDLDTACKLLESADVGLTDILQELS